jgi:pyruvate dehydrogenase E1 component alpha subunit
VIEFDTYRYYGHSVADSKHKGGYRCEEEIEKYRREHDPIQLFKNRLIAEGVITEEGYEQLDEAARDEADAAVDFAETSPLPEESDITRDVYWEVDRQTDAGRTGKHFFND